MFIYREFISFLRDIYERRFLIFELTKREIKSTYTGSALGAIWVILEPIAFMCILWLFFGVGLRTNNVGGAPFIVYLASGLISWYFFAQTFNSSTGLIRRYSYVVNKVNFRLSILPIVNILTASVSHFILVSVVLVIALFNDIQPNLYFFQLFYYFCSLCLLLLGLGWLTSSINVFATDVGKIVGLFVQFGFWMTPIFWQIGIVPNEYQYLVKANPMYYIVDGYRNSIIYKIPFWDAPYLTLYYWSITLVILIVGAIVFKRLRPHFAHVI